MKTIEQVTASEEVVMVGWDGKPKRVKIERVGRTNLYVGGEPFDRKTGRSKDGYASRYLKTTEEFERQEQASKARAALREFGVDVQYHLGNDVVLAIHAALKPIMDASR